MTLTIKSALNAAGKKLKEAGISTPHLDAEVLLSHVTGVDRAGLYRGRDCLLSGEEEAGFFALVERRLTGEPVAYLTGRKEFMGFDFTVNRSVMIPRPETELLVEKALAVLPENAVVVDVGTGSGIIAVTLALLKPGAVVYAVDCSPEALEVARLNAVRHGVAERVFFYHGSLLEPLAGNVGTGGIDLIAANLPYICAQDLPLLPREVRLFEPPLAFDGGADGLAPYRALIPAAGEFLRTGGYILLEIGYNQGQEIKSLLGEPIWDAEVMKDLAGLDRLLLARLKSRE
ncbi:MAG TPA: peptide chain release factor N(5)-glutamine methyltransferase [Bacillota bacterium]|nr:peptide chain release factor N(5)-glutamine methyltransferase [Bacillota bacterium]